MNNDFVEFLREIVDEKSLKKICFRFGGNKVYIPHFPLAPKILEIYETTSGTIKQRIDATKAELDKQGFNVGKNKIRWTINNGKKRNG